MPVEDQQNPNPQSFTPGARMSTREGNRWADIESDTEALPSETRDSGIKATASIVVLEQHANLQGFVSVGESNPGAKDPPPSSSMDLQT